MGSVLTYCRNKTSQRNPLELRWRRQQTAHDLVAKQRTQDFERRQSFYEFLQTEQKKLEDCRELGKFLKIEPSRLSVSQLDEAQICKIDSSKPTLQNQQCMKYVTYLHCT